MGCWAEFLKQFVFCLLIVKCLLCRRFVSYLELQKNFCCKIPQPLKKPKSSNGGSNSKHSVKHIQAVGLNSRKIKVVYFHRTLQKIKCNCPKV